MHLALITGDRLCADFAHLKQAYSVDVEHTYEACFEFAIQFRMNLLFSWLLLLWGLLDGKTFRLINNMSRLFRLKTKVTVFSLSYIAHMRLLFVFCSVITQSLKRKMLTVCLWKKQGWKVS